MISIRGYRNANVIAMTCIVLLLTGVGSEKAYGVFDVYKQDTVYFAIDMTQVEYPSARNSGRGFIGDVPIIPFKDVLTGRVFVWVMTLDPESGRQQGDRLEIELSTTAKPVDVMMSKHFLSSRDRGTVPSPFILFEDHSILTIPLTFDKEGTPIPGPPYSIDPLVNPEVEGWATCLAEISELGFTDGRPRLFIGTELGNIVVLVNDPVDGIVLEQVLEVSNEPIEDLEVFPQYLYLSLGILTGDIIYGVDPGLGGKSISVSDSETLRFTSIYSLADPRPSPITDLDVFGPSDTPLTDPDQPVKFIVANGTDELGLASISASQEGDEILSFSYLDQVSGPVNRVSAGSLLKLLGDNSAAMYDPDYSEDTGSSDCEVNITDGIGDACGIICGDANGDETINIADAVYIIDYVFRGGPPPDPLCVGDANGDGSVNVADAVHLINYIFKGGPAPVEDCCP